MRRTSAHHEALIGRTSRFEIQIEQLEAPRSTRIPSKRVPSWYSVAARVSSESVKRFLSAVAPSTSPSETARLCATRICSQVLGATPGAGFGVCPRTSRTS